MATEASMEILARLRAATPELRRRFWVRSLSVFGSVARGDAETSSDVDILVEFSRNVGLFHLVQLRRHLAEVLGRAVDVGTPDSLRPTVRSAALREAVRVA